MAFCRTSAMGFACWQRLRGSRWGQFLRLASALVPTPPPLAPRILFLLHPISLPQVDRLAMVLSCAPAQTEGWSEVSPAAFEEWRAQNHSFESLAVYPWDDVNLIGLSQRVHEIGIRMAIGKPTDVLRMFILNGLKLLAFGIVIGLPLAFALARLLSSLLFGPNSTTLPASLEAGWFSWRSCSLPATSRRAPPLAWIPSLP